MTPVTINNCSQQIPKPLRLQIFSFLPGYESFTLQYFLSYGPAYQLDIPPSQRQDMNTPEDLANVLNTVTGNFNILTPCGFTLFCLFFGEKLFKIIRISFLFFVGNLQKII